MSVEATDAGRTAVDGNASSAHADAAHADASTPTARTPGLDAAPQDRDGEAGRGGSDAAAARDAPSDGASTAPAASVPSAGCGKAGRPAGGLIMEANDHIYSFPESYDGATPLPAVFAFHAASNPIDQLYTITRGSELAAAYVMVFPKSTGTGWTLNSDGPRLDGWISDLFDHYCIDQSRVFATGHSSGAQFIVQLLCRGEHRFKAVAPVASSVYCPSWSPIPALVIHGRNDSERAMTSQDADGRKDLQPYLTSDHCASSSAPYDVAGCMSGGTRVDPGCVRFDGCQMPVLWCNHNDPSYSNTNHGWPCFANQAIFDFFRALP